MKQIPVEWNNLTSLIIASAIEVHSRLGPGQLEHLYEEAMVVELGLRGLPFARQRPIRLKYKGVDIGDMRVDLIVADLVVVELKCVERVLAVHLAQLTSYLRSTGLPLGLLINFNHVSLTNGISRRINPHSPLVVALPNAAVHPRATSDVAPSAALRSISAPSEFLPEGDQ